MRSRPRPPAATAAGIGLLMVAAACTGAPSEPEATPEVTPTSYVGEPPPGLAAEPVRVLDDASGTASELLGDSLGVRIQAVGHAFLISSNSEERHVLQRAADGETLWEGRRRVERFTRDRDGEAVFTTRADDETAAISHEGEEVWHSTDPRDVYIGGWAVRRPSDYSPEDPHGTYTVSDTSGEEVWSFTFEESTSEENPDPADASDDRENAAERLGAPLTASGDTLLLTDGDTLQARDLASEGELRWRLGWDSGDLGEETELPDAEPRVVGVYDTPAEPGAATEDSARPAVLVRWSHPEEPSLLSLVDRETGEVRWRLTEPGTNPLDHAFEISPVAGTVHNAATHTLLVPQSNTDVPIIAVDMVTGTVRWSFDTERERAISPAFALGDYFYGDTRGPARGNTQVVLDSESKEIVTDEPDGYVEDRTEDGYALVVQNRRRFLFHLADGAAPSASATPEG